MNLMSRSTVERAVPRVLALAVVALTGCAHVKPEQMNAELARLREQMRTEYKQGDQKVAADLNKRVDGVDARLNALADQLAELGKTFDVTVERLQGAVRFNAPVFFAFDDASIRPQDRAVLDRFAEVIKGYYPGVAITAEGFTDRSGSATYNRALGRR